MPVDLHGTGQAAGRDRRSGAQADRTQNVLNTGQNIPPQFLEPEGDPAAKRPLRKEPNDYQRQRKADTQRPADDERYCQKQT